jgi:hypothetical protein
MGVIVNIPYEIKLHSSFSYQCDTAVLITKYSKYHMNATVKILQSFLGKRTNQSAADPSISCS